MDPKRRIVIWPDNRLLSTSTPVTNFDEKLHELLDDMKLVMELHHGAGLAAIQVGEPVRVALAKAGEETLELINPVITAATKPVELFNEGCLSLPNETFHTQRFDEVTVEYQDRNGNKKVWEAKGMEAVEAQHEIDHMSGRLLVMSVGPMKRDIIRRRLIKFKKLLEVAYGYGFRSNSAG